MDICALWKRSKDPKAAILCRSCETPRAYRFLHSLLQSSDRRFARCRTGVMRFSLTAQLACANLMQKLWLRACSKHACLSHRLLVVSACTPLITLLCHLPDLRVSMWSATPGTASLLILVSSPQGLPAPPWLSVDVQSPGTLSAQWSSGGNREERVTLEMSAQKGRSKQKRQLQVERKPKHSKTEMLFQQCCASI